MNERIKELADQLSPVATIGNWGRVEWSDNVYPQLGDKMYAAIDLENFAELIVRECIDKITTYDLVPGHSAKWEDIYDIHTRLLQDLGEELKEHFGVEE